MKTTNEMRMVISSKSINEGFSRTAVCAFILSLDPTIDEITDIKTAVSEAVTNAVVHGYKEKTGKIYINVSVFDNNMIRIKIRDKGVGIADVKMARLPLYSSSNDIERAGLGFSLMESCMDKIKVVSKLEKGTSVTLEKKILGKNS